MNAIDTNRLAELEATIENGLTTFVTVGTALREIQEAKLYLASHKSFDLYCKDKWGMSRAHAYRQIAAATVAAEVSPVGDNVSLANENSARELAKHPPEDRERIVSAAAVIAAETSEPDGVVRVTSAAIKKAAAKSAPPKITTDELGQPVPPDAIEAFEHVNEFYDIATDVGAILAAIQELSGKSYGRKINLNAAKVDLKNVRNNLHWAKPYAVCPLGRNCGKNCRACKGTKFLTQSEYNALPPEMKAA